MVAKWDLKQHKRIVHALPIDPKYAEFRNQVLDESMNVRKQLFKAELMPITREPISASHDTAFSIKNHGVTITWAPVPNAVNYMIYIGHGPVPGYAKLNSQQRYPSFGHHAVYQEILNASSFQKVDGKYLWVPRWVENAINTYLKNEGYAGMKLSEFVDRTNPDTGVSLAKASL